MKRLLDNVFQLFCITKPTGQGTGLLLSYDNVKAHGGEIKVNTKEVEGTEFIIHQLQDGYEPTVSVSTKRMGDKVLISVKDNGNGIPQKVLDKIFQPFFTTKPTGQGTGLGLSLGYDVIKAHGGELKAETKEGEGATFIINLPI